MNKRWLVPLLLLIAAAGGGWTLQNRLALDRRGEWSRVTRDDLIVGIDITGTLAASESASLGPPKVADMWNFKISMMAPEGSEVKAGTPVLSFDTTELQRELEAKSAERDSAAKEIEKRRADLRLRREENELQLAEAEAELRRADLKMEAPPEIVGSREMEKTRIEHELASRRTTHLKEAIRRLQQAASAEIGLLENKHALADERVEQIQRNLRMMTVMAPRDGTVIYLAGRRGSGEKRKIGDTLWRAETVMEIPDLTTMLAQGEVDESDAGKVRIGQRVSFRLDAHPDRRYEGTIRSIGRTVQRLAARRAVKVLRVEIELDQTDPATMRPGMRLRGTIELDRVKSATIVPPEAVFFTEEGAAVTRRSFFGANQVSIAIGKRNQEAIEVVEGLEPGDQVLIPKIGETEAAP
ncbi:MAG TPA: HlyD family efflux transporter periplasmic adaptor subunit [Thermoanaerobaculia bacterium]|nr:HlyD family efflux transporter periplasmic adaptor subunit [Thermoanaerobaculia bacterium]